MSPTEFSDELVTFAKLTNKQKCSRNCFSLNAFFKMTPGLARNLAQPGAPKTQNIRPKSAGGKSPQTKGDKTQNQISRKIETV